MFGVLLAFMVGPAFFALIQTSIHKGFRAGATLAFGISSSDSIYILLSYIGVSSFVDQPGVAEVMALVGGGVMVVYAALLLLKPPKEIKKHESRGTTTISKMGHFGQFLKGFFLNGMNPGIILFWIAMVGIITSNNSFSDLDRHMFFVGIITCVLSLDLTKAYAAHRLSQIITVKLLRKLNLIIGVVLLVFGLKLLYDGYQAHYHPGEQSNPDLELFKKL
ncbi:hypothetical protein PEPS_08010 [Persicobacter psychrovividus]|uniref:Threonine/homoserine/homoserine lactone efflux protein n=2 Tax=Persicobacter psychrovividus TaxID=387638 RepID=A0ABN6L6A1_9BACT|nr:hypothetical protein PEPS_08010 [Persicobacter psychrovividus]